MKWTKEQEQAIVEDGNNILVAAAAGSGKTAVLVERMIQAITNKKIDIDSILIVTFTNAAASEMRERIVDAIYKKLEENPEDKHLQHQLLLLNRASICTIHSFCLEVIRNHFYETQESANFQIGDATEMELLKQEVMEEMFTEKYEKKDEEFLSLLEMYTSYDDDTALKELLFTVYQFIQSAPFPKQMLEKFTEELNIQEEITDFKDTKWGKVLLQEADSKITGFMTELNGIIQQMEKWDELNKFTNILREDYDKLEKMKMALSHFDTAYQMIQNITFSKWPVDRKVEREEKEIAKRTRDAIKKKMVELQEKLICCNSTTAIQELQHMYPVMKKIQKLVFEFTEKFTKAKREKNKIDFNDIEHLALQLLLKPKEDGTYEKTKIAEEYTKKFTQIAIDEYQDSNLVQENILKAISNGHNIFMVGDMKQSIYRFRQARPQLFLEKYRSYKLKEEQKQGEDIKIPLFKNFRSRKNILDITNLVFESIMSETLGEIEYNTTEYLNLGADFKELEDTLKKGKTELHIINLKEEEIEEEKESDTEEEPIENTVLEAKMVANKIKEIIKSGYPVYDVKKQEFRKATYKDIVILLRATSNLASIYEKELQKVELPVFTDVNTEYITATEVEMVLNLLKIIDNPMQDIPLVSVLRSPIFAFSDNDLIKIRIEDRNASFYQALQKARMTMDTSLKQKVEYFFSKLSKWQKEAEYMALDELIWTMYLDTGYYYYVGLLPNGQVRQANLKMLFERAREYEKSSFKGIFQFLRFMDKLKESSGDLGAAKVIGENEDVIRIMSIHKSKGLEFPIVFLCNSNKKFNMKDLNAPILLHTDLGMGPKVINRKMQQEYPSLALEAIKIQIRKETIAEEMRILYVALTRAKEKLFITGVEKDLKVEMQKKEEEIQKYAVTQKLDSSLVQKYRSYLDWIELVYLAKPKEAQELIEVQEHTPKEENSQEETVKQVSIQEIMQGQKEQDLKEIKQALEWEYPYQEAVLLPTKMSVTKIKEQAKEAENIENTKAIVEDVLTDTNKPPHVYRTPNFMAEELTITASQRGTLMHLCISKLQETEEYTIDKLKDLLQQMVKQKQILPKEAEAISIQKLYEYTQSSLFQELKKAKEIAKEQAFYLQIPTKEIYGNHAEEPILVQGIIDLYYISEKGELILVDYKTDYVEKGKEEELVEKYRKQLTLYQRALEQAKKKKVDKIYLYSIYLQKSIEVKEEKNCD